MDPPTDPIVSWSSIKHIFIDDVTCPVQGVWMLVTS